MKTSSLAPWTGTGTPVPGESHELHGRRIYVWGINYAPELTGIGPCNTALCDYLAGLGGHVEMISGFSYYPAWVKQAGDRGAIYRRERHGQVLLHRCWLYVPRQVSTFKRIAHELSFVVSTFLRMLTLPAADLVVVVSPPLALGFAAALLGSVKRIPFVFHVQDLQPDAAVSLGLLQQGWIKTILFWLERFSYRHAARVSGISRGMIHAFRNKGIAESKLIYFPNGVSIPPAQAFTRGAFRARHGLEPGDFVAVYSGNLGQKQGLEVLIDAGVHLQSTGVHIFVCGDGARRDALAERAAGLGLENVTLLPLQPADSYHEMLADADVCVITQEPGTGGAFLPSKLLPALAFGKPVLAVSDPDSELARAVTTGGFGLNITPPDPTSVAAALCELARDPERVSGFQRAAAEYCRQFEQSQVHHDFAAQLVALLNAENVACEHAAVSRAV